MSEPNENTNALFWRFDISTFKLLGRELITDRITALFELVKNAYDANASNVHVQFIDINPISESSKIIITDDGIGMTIQDIRDKWMVIGTNNKRTKRLSPPPMNRKVVGKKGVGRFAVDKLGSKLILKSKTVDDKEAVLLQLDWSAYENLLLSSDKVLEEDGESNEITDIYNTQETDQDDSETIEDVDHDHTETAPKVKYFTDIANNFWFEDDPEFEGTTLTISSIRDVWTQTDVDRAYIELAKLVSPLEKPVYPFNIFISASNYSDYKKKLVKNHAIRDATVEITLKHNKSTNKQEQLKFERGKLNVVETEYPSFGPVNFKLYYFNRKAKDLFKRSSVGASIDGIKIYRDGLIATPFAEYEYQDIKKRDILGIDKRRYSGFFDKVSSADLIGILDITDAENPEIKDSTNRQDFEDNNEYRDLRQFIVDQIIELEKFNSYTRDFRRERTQTNLRFAYENLNSFNNLLKEIKSEATPILREKLVVLERQSKQLRIEVNKGIKDYNELVEEKVRQENLFFSLMSLQDYAFEIAHVVRTSLSRIMSFAEYFKLEYPNPELEDSFILYANEIYDEMEKLDGVLNFLLSYAKSNIPFTAINIKLLIEDLFYNKYKDSFESKGIRAEVQIAKPLIITHNYKFLEDIIENLISNSIKAVEGNTGDKIIKCTGNVTKENFELLFSDNGYGIREDDKERVFNIYFTRTADKGGSGIGLYIVKTRIQSMKGHVEVIKSEFKPTGTTLKITLPFANPQQ